LKSHHLILGCVLPTVLSSSHKHTYVLKTCIHVIQVQFDGQQSTPIANFGIQKWIWHILTKIQPNTQFTRIPWNTVHTHDGLMRMGTTQNMLPVYDKVRFFA